MVAPAVLPSVEPGDSTFSCCAGESVLRVETFPNRLERQSNPDGIRLRNYGPNAFALGKALPLRSDDRPATSLELAGPCRGELRSSVFVYPWLYYSFWFG